MLAWDYFAIACGGACFQRNTDRSVNGNSFDRG